MDAKGLLAKWEAELASLEARRTELLVAIRMARRELGLPADSQPTPETPTAQPEREDSPRRPYLGMNILEAARLYLTKTEDPKSPSDIAEAIRRGGVHSRSEDFAGVVRTTLSRRGHEVGIESFGSQTWGLREWRPGRSRGESEP